HRLLLQPPQLLATRVRLAERNEAECVADHQQRADDGKADEQLRAERQRDAPDRADERIVRGPREPGPLRAWRGFERLLRDLHHSAASTGRVKRKVLPRPTSLSTQSRPPCSSTSLRESGSPRPVPSSFLPSKLCSNSSKI